jgi:hypothetical protein
LTNADWRLFFQFHDHSRDIRMKVPLNRDTTILAYESFENRSRACARASSKLNWL